MAEKSSKQNKMYNLFLDDKRFPEDCFEYTHYLDYVSEDWVIVRNYDEFIKTIQERGIPELVSFDHDLADEHYRVSMYNPDGHYSNYYTDGTFKEKTGYSCAKWLLDYCMDNKLLLPKHILVHSMNPIGGENIKSLFDTYNKIYGK